MPVLAVPYESPTYTVPLTTEQQGDVVLRQLQYPSPAILQVIHTASIRFCPRKLLALHTLPKLVPDTHYKNAIAVNKQM